MSDPYNPVVINQMVILPLLDYLTQERRHVVAQITALDNLIATFRTIVEYNKGLSGENSPRSPTTE